MIKEEQNKIKRQLRTAANKIAKNNDYSFICIAMHDLYKDEWGWKKLPSAKMLNPGTYAWWESEGLIEVNDPKSERLLGIAMMLTMPDDMIDFTL